MKKSEALIVRAVFGAGMASQRKDNSNFTFSVVRAFIAMACLKVLSSFLSFFATFAAALLLLKKILMT